jgi:hypothetical protein
MSDFSITTTIDIEASATDAWAVFGEGFGSWADWAPGIDRSTLQGPLGEGVLRTNETPSLGTVEQELVQYDPSQRALAYEMRTLPPMFTKLRNDWTIKETGAKTCQLIGDATFVVAQQAEPMREKLEGKMGMTLEVFAKAFRDRMHPREA